MTIEMATVLVIEDDPDVRVMLATALHSAGHTTLSSGHGRSGLEFARSGGIDLVILDRVLPDIAGDSVLESLKDDPFTAPIPVIMLSGRVKEADRVSALESGADDYVTKPFSLRELVLRTDIALRRSRASGAPATTLECGPLRVETDTRKVFLADRPLTLTPIEFRLLTILAGRRGRVQSRQSLLADVWGMQADLETRTVDTHIRRLREKLDVHSRLIETVRGVGYRLRDATERPQSPRAMDNRPVDDRALSQGPRR
jgi:two-component system, OmpR family, phosphate regulon response regulator PhoB